MLSSSLYTYHHDHHLFISYFIPSSTGLSLPHQTQFCQSRLHLHITNIHTTTTAHHTHTPRNTTQFHISNISSPTFTIYTNDRKSFFKVISTSTHSSNFTIVTISSPTPTQLVGHISTLAPRPIISIFLFPLTPTTSLNILLCIFSFPVSFLSTSRYMSHWYIITEAALHTAIQATTMYTLFTIFTHTMTHLSPPQ